MPSTKSSFTVSGITVELVRKNIKNLHLGVYPPNGRVRIAVPLHVGDEAVRLAVIKKLPWLRRQIQVFGQQSRLSEADATTGESWYLFGRRRLLRVVATTGRTEVVIPNKTRMELHVRPDASRETRLAALDRWYRTQLRIEAVTIFEKWESVLGVKPQFWGVKRMKTKWGSCNHKTKRIWLNSELAKKPSQCLEYVIVHELLHLIEPGHGERFVSLLDKHFPNWHEIRGILNSNPLAHENWTY